eukprot:4373706-Amphidinium_carterae.1
MPSATMRKIQKITNDEVKDRKAVSKGSPLGCLAHVPAPEGHTDSKRKRTSLNVLVFDMVAELAIAER